MKIWAEMTNRERDALVAEKVMGCKVEWREWMDDKKPEPWCGCDNPDWDSPKPHQHTWDGDWQYMPCWVKNYSTDIAAAFEVVEKMREKGWRLYLESQQDSWMAGFTQEPDKTDGIVIQFEEAGEAPEAISLAALTALGVEV